MTLQSSITCPICFKTSYNENDVRYGYCANCHAFTGVDYLMVQRYKYHIVEFTEDSYGLQHPEECLPNLLDCEYDQYLRSLSDPDQKPGRYGMKLVKEIDGFEGAAYWELTN